VNSRAPSICRASRALRYLARRLSAERGVTVIEVLVASLTFVVVAGAAMTFMIVSLNRQNEISSRSAAARQAEVGLEQLVRDLRNAMSQNGSGAALSVVAADAAGRSTLSFDIPTPNNSGVAQAVTWNCPDQGSGAQNVGSCTRTVAGATRTLIEGVQSLGLTALDATGALASLPATNPAYIGIALKVQVVSQLDSNRSQLLQGSQTTPGSPSTNPILIQAGVDLRNFA
jgi:hypothetical protein